MMGIKLIQVEENNVLNTYSNIETLNCEMDGPRDA